MAKKTQTTRKTQITKTTDNPAALFALLGQHAAASRASHKAARRAERCRNAGDIDGMHTHGAEADALCRHLVELEPVIAATMIFTREEFKAKDKFLAAIDESQELTEEEYRVYSYLLGRDAARVDITDPPRFIVKRARRLMAEALRTYNTDTEHGATAA